MSNRVEGGLLVSVDTPLADGCDVDEKACCILERSRENGHVIFRLGNDGLGREWRANLRTDK